jgi:hypothetical protein
VNRIRTARFFAASGILTAGVLGFAAPAMAAGGDSVTIFHQSSFTVQRHEAIQIASTAQSTCGIGKDLTRKVSLTLTGPTGSNSVTQTLKSERLTCQETGSLKASPGTPSRNGSYTVTLQNGSPSRTTTAALDVIVPPAQAHGLTVSTKGTIATFRWSPNSEPDLTGYQITNSSDGVDSTVRPSAACTGGSCSTSVNLGPSAAGHTEKFAVRAVRCGMSCSDDVVGPNSPSASATFAGRSTPTPTPTPTHSGGTGGSGGSGNSGGGSGTGSGSGDGGSGTSGTTTTSTTGTTDGGQLPGSGSGDAATDAPSRHGAQTKVKPLRLVKPGVPTDSPSPQATTKQTSPTHAITRDTGTGGSLGSLWRGIAAAAVLLLIVVHLRAWATRADFR